MSKGTLTVHSENILPIIKKWLYSERDIFVRELISNACDAIQKVKVLREQGEVEATDETFRIEVTVDKEQRTLTFSDTGLGMDGAEVERYIAQLAFSGAEEFVQRYQSEKEEDQIIGHFGLGFYSAYMVADVVEIVSRSYRQESTPVRWRCEGSAEYELEEGEREQRGTDVILHIGSEHDEFLDESRLRQLLNHYCGFLPIPIYLNGQQLNEKEPLWIKPVSACEEKEYRDFYRHLYPTEEEPLFWIHLNIDYPFNLKGILYFPRVRRDFDFSRNAIKLFCNRVFVSDSCKDLIPDYLMVLRGAIDSPDLPLNVSRSALQMDRTVRQLASHIAKKVSDRLTAFYRNERDRFLEAWSDLEVIVKLGAAQDEKFYERVKECLIWKNSEGEWTTVEEYLERNRDKTGGKVFYAPESQHPSHFLDLYKQKGIEVLYASSPVDTHTLAFLEHKLKDVTFQRIDGSVDELILDRAKEKTILDEGGKTEAVRLADYVKSALGIEGLEVEAKSLASQSLPAFLMLEEKMRRMRDMMAMSDRQGEMADALLQGNRKLVVNTNSPLMEAISNLRERDPELSKQLTRQVYDLSLLGQRELRPDQLDPFIQQCTEVLEKLACRKE